MELLMSISILFALAAISSGSDIEEGKIQTRSLGEFQSGTRLKVAVKEKRGISASTRKNEKALRAPSKGREAKPLSSVVRASEFVPLPPKQPRPKRLTEPSGMVQEAKVSNRQASKQDVESLLVKNPPTSISKAKTFSPGDFGTKMSSSPRPTLKKSASTNSLPKTAVGQPSGIDLKRSGSIVGSDLEKAEASLVDAQKKNNKLVEAERNAANRRRGTRSNLGDIASSSPTGPHIEHPYNPERSRSNLDALWNNAAQSTAYSAAADAALKAQNWGRYQRNSVKAETVKHGALAQAWQLRQGRSLSRSVRHQDMGTQLLAQGDEKGNQYLEHAKTAKLSAEENGRRMDESRLAYSTLRAQGGKDSDSESDIG